jgi:hypothetical protein
MLKKVSISLIVVLTALTIFFYLYGNLKFAVMFGLIDITVIVFSILVWFNDKYYNEQISERIVSFPSKEMIKDILKKQSNMLRFDKF